MRKETHLGPKIDHNKRKTDLFKEITNNIPSECLFYLRNPYREGRTRKEREVETSIEIVTDKN